MGSSLCGELPAEGGELPAEDGELPAEGGELPAAGGELPATAPVEGGEAWAGLPPCW